MAIRKLLQFRNLDLTKDLNDRYTGLFVPGVFDGGSVIPVVGELQISIIPPWKLINADGMVVEETSDTYYLSTPAGQITVITCKAIYYENNVPDIEILAIEKSAYDLLPDQSPYVVFAYVDVPIGATIVLSRYIQYSYRNTIDKIGRNTLRGVLSNASLLPLAKDSLAGDVYMVADGIGGTPQMYGWDGFEWIILTDAAIVEAELAAHRANEYINEKHATDNQKNALVGTSGTAPSASNPYVDNADTRIPTQNENDALQGSDGTPSGTNRYITEQYPLAIPEEKAISTAPISGYIELLSTDGPVYVGRGGAGSCGVYFRFYDLTLDREYTTSTGTIVNVAGVYVDSGLTTVLDPSIYPNVDANGFFNNASLYIKYDVAPDTGLKLLYGQLEFMGVWPINALMERNINSAQTSADAITTVEGIKGRLWDDPVPSNQTNVALRQNIVDLQEYVSSVFLADHVVGDFTNVEGVPDFEIDFVPNVGIPENYTYENTGLVGFSYTATTAMVTYISAVTLVGVVVVGNVFIDGSGNEFEITSILDNQHITIQKRNGIIPLSINNTVTLSMHGACKPDNNPRKINLANLQYIVGRERISCREIEVVPNEFHPVTNNVAFQIRSPLHSAYYQDPRVRFYGGFQNVDSGNLSKVVATNTGIILLTGFFTDVNLLVALKEYSPSILIKIDGDPIGTTIDLSRGNSIVTLGTDNDIQQRWINIASGLTDLQVHTIQITISDAADDFIIYGMDLFRLDVTTVAMLSGRAFAQSELFKKDTISTFTPPVGTTRLRGMVATHYINRSLSEATQLTLMTDFDGIAGGPAGTAISGIPNFTVTSGLPKFQYYKAGDVVKLITATAEEVKQIQSIGPGVGQITFSTNVITSGAAIITHVASSTGESLDVIQEYAQYTTSDLGTRQFTDFSVLFFTPSTRLFTVEDGTTSMVGFNIQYVTTGIDGVDTAIQFVDSTSFVRIRAVASQLNLLTANSTSVPANFSIDGCPSYSVTIPSGGLTNLTGWTNARYQTHELTISNASGMCLSGIILHEPTQSTKIEGTRIATQNVIADYNSSISTDGSVIPMGVIGVDTFVMGGVFVNGTGTGTGWTSTLDITLNPYWYRYVSTDLEGSYFEYPLFGTGFELEYLAKNDRGKPRLFLNSILATSTNFPTATFKNMNASTGEVDMYNVSATPIRQKFSLTGLPFGKYLLTLQVQTPRARNVASSGFSINIGPLYEANSSHRLSYSPSKGYWGEIGTDDFAYGFDWARDERNFDSGAISKEEVPVIRTVMVDTRAQRIALAGGTTSATVAFSSDLGTTDYSLACNLSNIVDTVKVFQPITVTNYMTSGFTVQWNDPLDSSNYYLNYTATKFS